jgi:hypothetical protein
MAKTPTYRRLLKQPTDKLKAKVEKLSDQEERSAVGSPPRKRLLRLLRKELLGRGNGGESVSAD